MLNNFDLTKVLSERTNEHYIALYDINTKDSGITYTNLPGKFPITPISGNNYILVLYDYEIIRAYNISHTHLTDRGLTPKFQNLDNEA
eukprot:12220875-Ditylum_brightwellii.AAC.1